MGMRWTKDQLRAYQTRARLEWRRDPGGPFPTGTPEAGLPAQKEDTWKS